MGARAVRVGRRQPMATVTARCQSSVAHPATVTPERLAAAGSPPSTSRRPGRVVVARRARRAGARGPARGQSRRSTSATGVAIPTSPRAAQGLAHEALATGASAAHRVASSTTTVEQRTELQEPLVPHAVEQEGAGPDRRTTHRTERRPRRAQPARPSPRPPAAAGRPGRRGHADAGARRRSPSRRGAARSPRPARGCASQRPGRGRARALPSRRRSARSDRPTRPPGCSGRRRSVGSMASTRR